MITVSRAAWPRVSFLAPRVPALTSPVCLCPPLLPPCCPSEPTNVELYVDGVSDICTKGGDINFVFTGFSVNGKVGEGYFHPGLGGVRERCCQPCVEQGE